MLSSVHEDNIYARWQYAEFPVYSSPIEIKLSIAEIFIMITFVLFFLFIIAIYKIQQAGR
jgi:hypothetical protein